MDIWLKAQEHERRIRALEEELAETKRVLAAVQQLLVDMDPVRNARKRMRGLWMRGSHE